MKTICLILSVLVSFVLMSCEHPVYEQVATQTQGESENNVTVKVVDFLQTDFSGNPMMSENRLPTRAVQPIRNLCSRISFVVFSGDEKVKKIDQKSDDANFGSASFSLPAGDYRLVVLAHNCNGTATVTSLEKITFPSNKLTDTFLYSQDITIVEGNNTVEVVMERVVSMFRLTITDEIPSNAASLLFYYTGGSSTLSALTGFGSVNSRQQETREIVPGQRSYEVYTIPHEQEDMLSMTITAYDADNNEIKSMVFMEIPVSPRVITEYSGAFFTPDPRLDFTPKAEKNWDDVQVFNF